MVFRENMKIWPAILLFFLMAALPQLAGASVGAKSFSSPEKGVAALVSAVKSHKPGKIVAVLGPDSDSLVSSGDEVADRSDREKFLEMYAAGHAIDRPVEGRAVLLLGAERYPFPFPLVKRGKGWSFDTAEGREEIISRRIGKNELSAIQVARAYVDAQREYIARDRDRDGINSYALRFRSSPGKRDGLYWESAEGEESPLGPLVAQAGHEGYVGDTLLSPYHGYLFRILTSQGDGADGGAFDYIVNNRMVLGFALIAYPAQYGASGIMTFMVNQGGVVYEKDLGLQTSSVVEAMRSFSPDGSWRKLP